MSRREVLRSLANDASVAKKAPLPAVERDDRKVPRVLPENAEKNPGSSRKNLGVPVLLLVRLRRRDLNSLAAVGGYAPQP